MAFQSYLLHFAPVVLADILIRQFVLRAYAQPSQFAGLLWRAITIIYITWPIYTLAWLMAVLRIKLAFRPTPKASSGHVALRWLAPQFASMLLLSGSTIYHLFSPRGFLGELALGFAVVLIAPQALFFWHFFADAPRETPPDFEEAISNFP